MNITQVKAADLANELTLQSRLGFVRSSSSGVNPVPEFLQIGSKLQGKVIGDSVTIITGQWESDTNKGTFLVTSVQVLISGKEKETDIICSASFTSEKAPAKDTIVNLTVGETKKGKKFLSII